MNSLSKYLFLGTSFLLSVLLLLLFNSSYSKRREDSINQLTSITKLPGMALSTTYLENRVLYYDDYSNRLYPQMKNNSKTSFVYAK